MKTQPAWQGRIVGPPPLRLRAAAMTLIQLMEEEAVGWELDDPQDDEDELNLNNVMVRWWGKRIAAAWRELKEASSG